MSDRGALPAGFLAGVATSGYQMEGGFNALGEPANNWVTWERAGLVEPSGLACDFWRHPEVALDRAAAIGCNAFRLSVEWARLEPAPGHPDAAALERYGEILAMCATRGMEPVVTLHHFTHPAWLGEEFWLTPGSPDRFADHVAHLVPALAPHCRRWVTINEPNIVALMGWVQGAYPPGRKGAVADAWAVLDNLLVAHVLAYGAIHQVQPEAVVTLNTSSSSLYEHDHLLTDLLLVRAAGVGREDVDDWVDERRALHDLACLPEHLRELALRRLFALASPYGSAVGRWSAAARSRLRRPSPRRVVDAVYASPHPRTLDAAGFDWYDPVASHGLRLPGHRTAGGRQWRPSRAPWDTGVGPHGLSAWCREEHQRVGDLPVWVVESGLATRVHQGRPYPRVDGWSRPAYLGAHLGAVMEALDDGVPVGAFLYWSLVDNYEWGSFEPRFGLFGLERDPGGAGVRWLDTDANGVDAAGAYRRLLAGLRAGDRSVLESVG